MTRIGRVLRAALSAAVLAVLVVGLPVLIAVIARATEWPQSWGRLHQELFTASTDNPLLGPVLLVIGTVAWLHLVFATLVELVFQARRIEPPELTLPSLRISQGLVHGLVAAVLAGVLLTASAGPAVAALHPVTVPFPGVGSAPRSAPLTANAGPAEVTSAPSSTEGRSLRVQVQPGDTLWALAEHHLGRGAAWPMIWRANRDVLSDPSTVPAGTTLTIPAPPVAAPAAGWVTVQAGQTLRDIAHRHLGDETRWPEIYRLNAHRIADPDLLQPGWKLRLPTTLPAAPTRDAPVTHHRTARPASTPGALTSPAPARPTTQPTQVAPRAPTTNPSTPRAVTVPSVTAVPRRTAPAATPAAAVPSAAAATDRPVSTGLGALTLGGLSCFAAAGVLGLLGARRRRQMRRRRPGQRIPMPAPEDRDAELEALAVEQPATVAFLDTVLRDIAAHAGLRRRPLPALLGVRLDAAGATLVLSEPQTSRPDWVRVDAVGNWRVDHATFPTNTTPAEAQTLAVDPAADPRPDRPPAPYPALLTLGPTTDGQSLLLLNLEAARALTLTVDQTDQGSVDVAEGVLAAMAVEFATSRLADHLVVHAVGWGADLAQLTLQDRFHHHRSLTNLLPLLEASADSDEEALTDAEAAAVPDARARPGATDLLAPQLVLCAHTPTGTDLDRLTDLLNRRPNVALAAVATASADEDWTDPEWALKITPSRVTRLAAMGVDLRLQHLSREERSQLVAIAALALDRGHEDPPVSVADLTARTVDGTRAGEATPDESDSEDAEEVAAVHQDTPGRTPRGPVIAESGLAAAAVPGTGPDPYAPPSVDETPVDDVPVTGATRRRTPRRSLDATLDALADAPHLALIGDLDVVGATGTLEQDDGTFLLLLATWIALHPGTSSQQVTDALWPRAAVDKTVARNTAMSKLRRWFGATDDGQPWLARVTKTGGYRFHPGVTTDWADFQNLSARGRKASDDDALLRALSLVRGRPLGNLTHSEHLWVDDLQREMTSVVVDTAHELAERSLAAGNTGVALHAIEQGMTADNTAETLWQDLIRTHAVSDDTAALHRAIDRTYLVLHHDLSADTIALIDEVTDISRRAAAS